MSPPNKRLMIIASTFLIVGIIDGLSGKIDDMSSEATIIQSFVLLFLFFDWVRSHAKYNNIKEPTGAALFVALFALLGIPYYFIRGFGWKVGLIKTSLAILYLISVSLISAITGVLVESFVI